MSTYEFALLLDLPPDEAEAFVLRYADPFFELFQGDVSPTVSNGRPLADCYLEGRTLDEAVRRAIAGLATLGLRATHVEVPAATFTAEAA